MIVWVEDALEPSVGYMVVDDPAGLSPVTDPTTLRVLPETENSLNLRSGDVLYITIIGNQAARSAG